MSAAKKILIVGGGIGGLSAGIALRKIGVEVELIELQPAFNVYGVGIIQQANALRALDAIGVADETMRRGAPYGKVKLCAPNGHQFGETGTPPIGRFPSHNGISRKILHDVLYEAALEQGVQFSMGCTVDHIDNGADQVRVELSDGRTETYDLLIAADGVNSKVRSLVFGHFVPRYINASVWRYAFPRPAGLETGYMYFGKTTKLGLIPMTQDSIYMFLVSSEGEDNPFIPESELVPRLRAYMETYPAPFVQELIPLLSDPQGVIYRPLETLLTPAPWYKDRVVLLGDAAHGTIPQLGSGAALAIEDAVVLAELLQNGSSLPHVMEQYMERRFERCKMVVDVSNTLSEWEQLEWKGLPLPEGANIGALMGKALMTLTQPI